MSFAEPKPHAASPKDVLTKALVRASALLGLSQRALARILGVSESSVSRLDAGRRIDPATKEGELALLFLRMVRSLDAVLGGDAEACRRWFEAGNHHLNGVPAELVQSAAGLVRVTDYLDAVRGKM
ncbi:MAG: antitoxin Xre/MbcA/ParS toxin-binding domain-containing protein [Planctomycetota bacterium]